MSSAEGKTLGPEARGEQHGLWLRRLSWVLWPSFLMGGVTEALVFAVLDPSDMAWFGGDALDWPRSAVYTVSFFIFWGVCAVSSALSLVLALSPAPEPHMAALSQERGD